MNSTEQYIYDKYSDFIQDLGYKIYYVEYKKEHKENFLRIFIENADLTSGIDIDACEVVSRACSDAFDNDVSFPIADAYTFEVSSPGIERELVIPEHFQRYIGEKIRLKLFKGIANQKEVFAVLKEYNTDSVVIVLDGKEHILNMKDISKAQLYCDF